MFDAVFQRFVEQAPCCVMMRAALEHLFADSFLDQLFEDHAQVQYHRELAFSTIASLLTEVVLRVRPSLCNAYRNRSDVPATLKSVYEKLKNVEPALCQALVERTAQRCTSLLEQWPQARRPDAIAGLRLRIVDGNFLAGTDHRLLPLRGGGAAALPGMSVSLRDDRTGLLVGLICREDAYTNERALLQDVLGWVEPGDLIVADRNYCTEDFLAGIGDRKAYSLIRHHAGMSVTARGELRYAGRTDTGTVYEQQVQLGEGDDARRYRYVVIRLDEPTRDGETEVRLLSDVPEDKASAIVLAELYLRRWTIETSFQQLTELLRCEIDTLGYPKAALLGFSLAVCAFNLMAVLKGALASVVGQAKVEEELSSYELAQEIAQNSPGMKVALPVGCWGRFAAMSSAAFAAWLSGVAQTLRWSRYTKSKRGPKKPVEVRRTRRGAHRSTARVLQQHYLSPKSQ
jgi:hypothetical protein